MFNSTSVAACGIAAHEAGHALQYAQNYAPIKFRMAIIKYANFGSQFATPLFFLGLLLSLPILCELGIIAFSAAVLFQLITLPVEFNASKRAKECIASYGASTADKNGVDKVLNAAAMTYVAALATSLLSLLRLIMISRSNRRD